MTMIPWGDTGIFISSELLDLIEKFRWRCRGKRNYRKPELALYKCQFASEEFVQFLAERNVDSKLVGCTHFIAKPPADLLLPYTNRDVEDWDHMFVEVEEFYIDWTARQIHPSAEFPYIFNDRTLVKTWGRIERFDL